MVIVRRRPRMPRPDLTYAFIASGLIHLSLVFIVAYWVALPSSVASPQAIWIEVVELPLTSSGTGPLLPPAGPLTPPKLLKEKALPSPPVVARRNPPLVGAGGTGTGTEAVHLSPLGGGRQETREAGGPDGVPQVPGPASEDVDHGTGRGTGAEDGSAASQPSLGGEGGSQSVEGAGAALTGTGAGQKGDVKSSRPAGSYQVKPWYPESARQEGIQGTTELKVLVRANGSVGQVLVAKSAGHFDLDRAAVEAVKTWRFAPARRGREAVAIWVIIPVQFKLE